MPDLLDALAVSSATPNLDRAGVEAARLVWNERASIVSTHPSVTYQLLAEARGVTENTARQWVHRRRTDGTMVSVDYDGQVLIPSFQFDATYEPVPLIAETVKALTSKGMTGWAVWRWFCTDNGWIEETPLAVATRGDRETLGRTVAEIGAEV